MLGVLHSEGIATEESNTPLSASERMPHLQKGLPGARHLQVDNGERNRQQPAGHPYQRRRRYRCHVVL